jgi:threonine/homoserine efflux transporter RhtA
MMLLRPGVLHFDDLTPSRLLPAACSAVLPALQVLFGCVWDVSLLHSHPSMAMWLGSAAIAAGVAGSTATASRGSSTPEAAAAAAGEAQE